MNKAIVVMGVSGSGKTSVGQTLASSLGWPFFDGDDFHPSANIEKMANGIPLTDQDRFPWLQDLQQLVHRHLEQDQSLVLACSALKARYRAILRENNTSLRFVYLRGSFETIAERMQHRDDHYMKVGMLQSQFASLEEPDDALCVSIEPPVEMIVREIIQSLGLSEGVA